MKHFFTGVFLLVNQFLFAQLHISGKVVDELSGAALPGATIEVVSTQEIPLRTNRAILIWELSNLENTASGSQILAFKPSTVCCR